MQLCRHYWYKCDLGTGSLTLPLCAACKLFAMHVWYSAAFGNLNQVDSFSTENLSAPGNQEVPLQLGESLRSVLLV